MSTATMLMTTTPTVMSVAAQFGADAVVWIDPDYEVLGTENRMLMVAASGAAMVLE